MVAWFDEMVRAAIYRPTAGLWWTRRGGGPWLVRARRRGGGGAASTGRCSP